jgi:hypothetical protein
LGADKTAKFYEMSYFGDDSTCTTPLLSFGTYGDLCLDQIQTIDHETEVRISTIETKKKNGNGKDKDILVKTYTGFGCKGTPSVENVGDSIIGFDGVGSCFYHQDPDPTSEGYYMIKSVRDYSSFGTSGPAARWIDVSYTDASLCTPESRTGFIQYSDYQLSTFFPLNVCDDGAIYSDSSCASTGGFTFNFYENPDCTGALLSRSVYPPAYCESWDYDDDYYTGEYDDDYYTGDDDFISLANVVFSFYCY